MALRTTLVFPDTHLPFHDHAAVELALAVLEGERPYQFVHLGDLADFASISRHPARKGGRTVAVSTEIAAVAGFVSDVCQASPKSKRAWIMGNHDARLELYIEANASAISDLIPDVSNLYGIPSGDVYVPEGASLTLGHVRFCHGLASDFQRNLQVSGSCIVTGHTHKGGVVYGGTDTGERYFAMECGNLVDHTAHAFRYASAPQKARWQHGLGVLTEDTKSGLVWANFAPFVNDTCHINGTTYRV